MNFSRLSWIDSMRGIATIFVMIFHFYDASLCYFAPKLYPNVDLSAFITMADVSLFYIKHGYKLIGNTSFCICGILSFGTIGIYTFFCVSGFIIPYSIKKYNNSVIKKFIISRFFRLYPLYWVSLILALAIFYIFRYNLIHTELNLINIFTNFTMFQQFAFIDNILPIYWTLQIELVFYILCALFFYFKILDNNKAIVITIFFMITVALLIGISRLFINLHLSAVMPLSLSLMFLCTLYQKYYFDKNSVKLNNVILSSILVLVLFIPAFHLAYDVGEFYRNLFSCYIAIVLFILFSRNPKIVNKFFCFIGKISYSMYLLHTTLGFLVLILLLKNNILLEKFGFNISFILAILIASVITIFLSTISYYLIEERFINIGKLYTKKQP